MLGNTGRYDQIAIIGLIILKEIDLLNINHRTVNIDGNEFFVPTEQFFNERALLLRSYFEAIVDRKLDADTVKIKDNK